MNPGQLRPPAVPLAASWILYGIVLLILPISLPRAVAVMTFLAVAATQVVFVAGLSGRVRCLAPVLVTAGVAVAGAAQPLDMRCDPYAPLLIGLGVFHATVTLAIRPRCGRWTVCVLGVYEVLVGASAMLACDNPLSPRCLLGAYAVGFGLTQLAYAYTLQELSRMTFQRRARAAR